MPTNKKISQLTTAVPTSDDLFAFVDNADLSETKKAALSAMPVSTATQTALNDKVDKVAGKGLSTEDYSSAEKSKLAGIESGAQVNVVGEAPIDGSEYARKDGAWSVVTGGGGSSTFETVAYPASLKIGSPVHVDTLQEIFNHQFSAGIVDGADLTDNLDGTVGIAAGTAFLRATSDPHTALYAVTFPAQTPISLTDNATNYVYIDYNAGSPTFNVSTSETAFNCQDKCVGYVVHRSGNVISWVDAREQNVDGNRKSRKLFRDFSRFIHAQGGTSIGSPSGTYVSVTAGSFYYMMSQITHVAFDTSVAGTANENKYDLYYRDGVGGFTKVADQKSVSTTTYDDGTGVLATLGNNKYGVNWFYIINDSPSYLVSVKGQAEYPDLASALAASPPTAIPTVVSGLGSLIGFVAYEKGASTFANVLSAFSTQFTPSQATSHNGLAGLQGGAVGEYYHLTSAQATVVSNTSGTNTGDQDLSGLVPKTTTLTINGTAYDLSANRSWTVSGSSLWTTADGTRTGNTTFTVSGDVTATFSRGLVIKWTESSAVKCGMVVSSSYSAPDTTVTIIGDTMASIDASSLKWTAIPSEKLRFAVAGAIGTVATNVANTQRATEALRVIGANLWVGTAGTTNNTTIDLNKAGTTMFTTKPTLATTVAYSSTPFTADSGTSLAIGDAVTLDVDAVQTTAAVDLYANLIVFPTRILNLS